MGSLSNILKNKIGKDRLSKAYVASEMGVSEKTIENYMNGLRQPKPEALTKLAAIVGFELNELSEQNVLRVNNQSQPKPPSALPTDPLERILHEKELLLKEKEARRQEAAERARRAEEQNDRLLDIIQENLNLLQTNSTKSLVYAETLLRVVQADDTVIMDNQDEGLNHEKGSSVAKAGTLELKIAQAQQKMDNSTSAHK